MESLANKTLTIVAFGAHPDPFDMPYQAGGTLAKYAKRGHRVVMVSASYEEEWQDEIAAIAKHLGAEYRFLDFAEGAIFDDPSHTHRIMAMIREYKADVVITHQPTDYHPDHRALSRGVLGACLLSRVGEVKSAHAPHKVGNLFYSDTLVFYQFTRPTGAANQRVLECCGIFDRFVEPRFARQVSQNARYGGPSDWPSAQPTERV